MINDFMSILPIRVWLFWVFVLLGICMFFGYKIRKDMEHLKKDHMKLATLIVENKVDPV